MLKIKIDDMGSGVFFTSDLHFRHGNIIKYCNRPFETVQEQTEKLIENWNKTVPDTATVFILGDFAFATKITTTSIKIIIKKTTTLVIIVKPPALNNTLILLMIIYIENSIIFFY